MGSWNEILIELNQTESLHDQLRRKYLGKLHQLTGRNIITYYSGWIQKPQFARESAIRFGINDGDKTGFMTVIHGMDRSQGVDLILHTPGGEMAATESIVDYLRSMFGTNIRAIVPQISMSGGTLLACACREILMGKQSSIGPIDPQFGNIPATGMLEEFKRAAKEIKSDPSRALVWQPILKQISPSFLTECEKAIAWSKEMAQKCLTTGMLLDEQNKRRRAAKIVTGLTKKDLTKTHDRHIGLEAAQALGLKITSLEADQALQDAVLSLHHAYMITLEATAAYKIIENQVRKAYVQSIKTIAVAK